jgi:hypothetical protein
MVLVLHPLHIFELEQLENGWSYGIKNYRIEVIYNGIISIQNLIQIYQLVQKLLGENTQTDTQEAGWWSYKVPFHFWKVG